MNRADISRANFALARAARIKKAEWRYQRFKHLRKGDGTLQQIAWDMEISRRQAERYSARLNREMESPE